MKLTGFDHGARGVGIRNLQLILPSVVCSTHISNRIAKDVGAITFAHQHGCGIIGNDVGGISDFFCELASHPNVGTVLIVGLGCETIQGNELAEKVLGHNPQTKYLVIQESGGVAGTFTSGIKQAEDLATANPPNKKDLLNLRVGIESKADDPRAEALAKHLKSAGVDFEVENTSKNSGIAFAKLMGKGVHVIVSFTDANQPPSGFPLIPTLNVSFGSALHLALTKDFDLESSASEEEIFALVIETAGGTETKSELSGSGEIIAPRVVRSV